MYAIRSYYGIDKNMITILPADFPHKKLKILRNFFSKMEIINTKKETKSPDKLPILIIPFFIGNIKNIIPITENSNIKNKIIFPHKLYFLSLLILFISFSPLP